VTDNETTLTGAVDLLEPVELWLLVTTGGVKGADADPETLTAADADAVTVTASGPVPLAVTVFVKLEDTVAVQV
jgi:hypothetical protein